MSQPKCPKCENSSFNLEELNVKKSSYKLYGVCCSLCGTIVGTHEYYNIGAKLDILAKALNIKL